MNPFITLKKKKKKLLTTIEEKIATKNVKIDRLQLVPFTINNATNRSVARTQYKELSWQWVWLMQRSLCRVKGQNQWSMLSPNCSAPPHPHNLQELEKTGELPESAKYEEGSFQLLRHGVEHSILSFYSWTWIACTLKKEKSFLQKPKFFKVQEACSWFMLTKDLGRNM